MDFLQRTNRHFAFTLIACVMLIRAIVPAGWMPTTGVDGLIRISVCTGMGAQTAWLDRDGKMHKEAPAPDHPDPQPCGFGMLGLGLDQPQSTVSPLPPFRAVATAIVALSVVAIGHGLAAPPPPSTGPPSLT